jgi:hypothetical protein
MKAVGIKKREFIDTITTIIITTHYVREGEKRERKACNT